MAFTPPKRRASDNHLPQKELPALVKDSPQHSAHLLQHLCSSKSPLFRQHPLRVEGETKPQTDEEWLWHFRKESRGQGSKDFWDSYVQMALKWAMGHSVQRTKINLVQSKTHKPHTVEMSGASAVNSAWLCFPHLPKLHHIIHYCRHRWRWRATVEPSLVREDQVPAASSGLYSVIWKSFVWNVKNPRHHSL